MEPATGRGARRLTPQATTTKKGKMINNSFINTLTAHREGDAIQELSEKLAEVCDAALLTGRAGKITLTFTVKPAGKSALAIVLEDDITVKVPKAEKVNSIFFLHEGALVRDNPKQLKMEFKPVAGGQTEESREGAKAAKA